MRTALGPGLEFLEYLAPAGGREAAAGRQTNDLASVTTVLVSDDAVVDALGLRGAGYEWVSPGAIDLHDRGLGAARMATVQDPDGHFVRLVQKGDVK